MRLLNSKQELMQLLNENYFKAYSLNETYVLLTIKKILSKLGFYEIVKKQCTKEDISDYLGIPDERKYNFYWLIDYLVEYGQLKYKNIPNSKPILEVTSEEISHDLDKLENELLQVDHTFSVSIKLIKNLADRYSDFLFNKINPLEIIFNSENKKLWELYFGNYFKGYKIYNVLAAEGVTSLLNGGAAKKVLELGAGIGGSTVSVIDKILERNKEKYIKHYIISDTAPILIKNSLGEIMNKADGKIKVKIKKLDFNISLNEQGISDNSLDIILAVNSLHIARNLQKTLKNIKKALKINGKLIISELVRQKSSEPLFQEFIFNLIDSYRDIEISDTRTTYGFLDVASWKENIIEAGFSNIYVVDNKIINKIGKQVSALVIAE